jgi:protease II
MRRTTAASPRTCAFRPVLTRLTTPAPPARDIWLPLTVGEFEEWGNPKLLDEYEYINSHYP